MFNTVSIATTLLFGIASDRAGALRFCLAGLALQIIGGLLALFAADAPLLLVSRLLEGVGFLAVIVSAPALIAAASGSAHRRFALGLWSSYMPIGGTLIIALSPLLLAAWGWRGAWYAVLAALIAFFVLLAAQRRHYASLGAGAPRSLAGIRGSLAQPVPWLLGGAFACYGFQFSVVMVWLPTYLLETRGTGIAAAALLTALYVFANALGTIFGGVLVHRQLPRGITIGTVFLITSTLFTGIFEPGLPDWLRFCRVLAYGFVTACIPPAVLSGGVHYVRSPAEAGTLQGLIVQISHAGIFLSAPLIAAAVTWRWSWDAALWILLAAGVLGFALACVIHFREMREKRH